MAKERDYWDGQERRINPCRRHDCADNCPIEDGVCREHGGVMRAWRYGLTAVGTITLAVCGMIWSEARGIHNTLSQLQVSMAKVALQVEVNTRRLDRVEDEIGFPGSRRLDNQGGGNGFGQPK